MDAISEGRSDRFSKKEFSNNMVVVVVVVVGVNIFHSDAALILGGWGRKGRGYNLRGLL